MSINFGGLSVKICKRIIGSHHRTALRQFSSNENEGQISDATQSEAVGNDDARSLPPLLSEQAQAFIAERQRLAEAQNDITAKVKTHFSHVVKSEFNQCFNVTCHQNSSVFIHAFSGYSHCAKCDRVELIDNFDREFCPFGSGIENGNDGVQNIADNADKYFTKMFPDQNVRKFKKNDSNATKFRRTLQFHKASKLFLDTLEDFNCYANHDNFSIYFTYNDANGAIVGHEELSCGSPGTHNNDSNGDKVQQQLLMKEQLGPDDRYLIITAGALNACAIYQTSSVTTISIKSCSNFSFPHQFVPLLAHYERVVFFLPSMASNYQIVHHVSRVLGQDRCYYISSQMGCKFNSPLDALKSLTSAEDFTDLLNEYSIPVNSLSSNFQELIDDARSFLADPRSSLGYAFHRFDILNELLGGLRLGEMTVISGDTGQGKTTFATELALDVCLHNNLPTAFVSLEMQPKITLLKMGRQLILQEVNLNNFDFFKDAITNVPMFISNCSGYIVLKDILLEFEKMCMQFGVRHIIIDHLQYLQGIELLDNKVISSAEELVSVNRVLRKLKQFVSAYNIHMTILAQPRKQYSGQGGAGAASSGGGAAGGRILSNHEIAGTVALTQIPDNILILQAAKSSAARSAAGSENYKRGSGYGSGANPTSNSPVTTSKYIEVTKNRFKGRLGVMPLMFCEKSGTFSIAAATHVK